MTYEPALDRKPAFVDRRSSIASAIAGKSMESQPAGANALRSRVGNQGMQKLIDQSSAQGSESSVIRPGVTIQAKLTINQPGDAHEQEADRVADAVMRIPEPMTSIRGAAPVSSTTSLPAVQRLCAECDEERSQRLGHSTMTAKGPQVQRKEQAAATPQVTHAVSANIDAMRGGGSSLPLATRAFFEPRFGADFTQVHVHTDAAY